jgi:AraC family transcriptional regulator, regulatory protein of adaptative response / methylated-DNA-[protein]-cysteine methyltransferase
MPETATATRETIDMRMPTSNRVDEEKALKAFWERDGSFDGRFVFGVTTTRIFCLASCPARRPRPEHLRLFASWAEAERAGFRACLRCRPKEPLRRPDELVARAKRLLDGDDDDRKVGLVDLGRELGLSPSHLHRTFKRVTGLTPREYRDVNRLQRLKEHLRTGDGVAGATYEAGYSSSSRVYERADGMLGMTPGSYRRGGLGLTIAYATARCPLGILLVAATERGICFAAIGDEEAALLQALHQEFPNASVEHAKEELANTMSIIAACLDGQAQALSLPLDAQGTDFQVLVWKALREIPPGETRTYTEIARRIGKPAAARAVGRACATNRVPLLIPCHRAVRADGDTGGYRWGSERKAAILAAEKAARPGQER